MSFAEELRDIANLVLEEDERLLKDYYKDIDEILRNSAKQGNHQESISFCDSGERTLSYIPNIELEGIKNKVESMRIIKEHYVKEGFEISEEWCSDMNEPDIELKVISFHW